MKRKIAAILAADIAGYSRLVAEDEEETLRRLADYQGVFKDLIVKADGRIFNTAGDSVLAEFPSAVDALRCAINVQESLRIRNQAYPMSRQMAYRMGLTIGDVVEHGSDLLGDGVNIAARLEGFAQPGGICISKALHDAVSSKLSVHFVDMGSHQVKNIPLPVHVFSVSPEAKSSAASGARRVFRAERLALPSHWPKSSLMATGVAVAIASALAVSLLPRLIEPAKTIEVAAVPAAPQKSPPTADVAAAPAPPSKPDPSSTLPDVAAAKIPGTPAKDGPVSRPVAVTEPAPSTVPATSPVTAEDPAAALRLRPIRWTACNSDDTDAALKACRALVADTALSGADLARAEWRLGYTIRKSGDLDGAITSLSDSVKTLATAEAHNDRGIAYLLKGDFDNALADYNEAIKLDDKNGEAWNNRAWTYYKTGQNQKARADADKAVSLIGDKAAYVWDTRGHINEALGDRKAAEADFVKAISLDPKLTASRDGLKRLTGH